MEGERLLGLGTDLILDWDIKAEVMAAYLKQYLPRNLLVPRPGH